MFRAVILKIPACILVLCINAFSVLHAQEIDLNNLQNIDVDNLTEDQLINFSEEVQKRGLTEQQLQVIARSRGVGDSQVSKLMRRLKEIESINPQNLNSDDFNRLRDNQIPSEEASNDNDLFQGLLSLDEDAGPEIFGFDFFSNSNLSFEPSLNVPTPKGYVLGAADELLIDVWGASEKTYQLTISPEGNIFVPNLGPVMLSGLTIEQATKKVKSRLKQIYSGIDQSTYVQVSLGQIRRITVNIVGEIKRPGTYTISSFATVLNALYYAGGPNEIGSLRQVDIYRNAKLVESCDIYEFLTGQRNELSYLEDQDLIIVRPYSGRVLVEGEIKKPAVYEIKDGETLQDLLDFCGGFGDQAYRKNLTIRRNNPLNKSILTVQSEQFGTFKVQGGDEVLVSEIIQNFENRVQINGAVNKPGEYERNENITLRDLILSAEGLRGDAFMGRAVVVRTSENLDLSAIAVNLNDIMNQSGEPFYLRNNDLINIQSKFDLKEDYTVNVQGEINSPGRYLYVDSLTVEDIIFLANGFKESAATSFVEVARRIESKENVGSTKSSEIFNFAINDDLRLDEKASKFVLKPFDLIIVRKSPDYISQEIVEVEGEVNFPGKYAIEKKDERISDLLSRAGGLTNYGYVKGATLIRRTEYYVDEEDDVSAAKLRRENLRKISQRDTLISDIDLQINQQESIGINLENIIKAPGSNYDLILEEGDVLSIPRQLQTVRMRGELFYPGTVQYEKGNSFKQYISIAGGWSDNANIYKSYIVYANGSARRTRRFLWIKFYPKVEPGAEIIVPKKPVKTKLSATEIVGITTGVATFGLVVLRLVDFIDNSNSN
jgi:protein involved in polysaccharide export with SLBB domain